MAQNEPTIASILQELASHYDRIVAEREVFDRVLEQRPSQAKDPYASIREKLRFGAPRLGWVRLGGGELIPLRVALEGLRFRVIPTDDELTGGMIDRTKFEPFVNRLADDVCLEDRAGALHVDEVMLPIGEGIFGPVSVPALSLGDWFARAGFVAGDSILVTIVQAEPPVLRLEREPAAAFQVDDVLQQERELVDALAERVSRGRTNMLFSEDSVLPIYARATWRTGYPGRPWQQLVSADRRLRLVDGSYIADSSFRRPLDMILSDEEDEQRWEAHDQALLGEISAFQAELLASRREAAEHGLWNGIAPRASTGRVIFDVREGTSQMIHPGIVDALQDHSALIEQRAANGDYDSEDWFEDMDAEDFEELEFTAEAAEEDPLFDAEDIEDMRAFMEQNPALVESTQKLMASLTPDEIVQLQEAETPDEVQRILTSRLNKMLFSDPALFVTLAEGNPGGTNGTNGHKPNADILFKEAEEWEQDGEEWEDDEDWDEDDEDWDEEDEEWDEVDDPELAGREGVIKRSNELMEQFHRYQLEMGKSEATATSRTGDLWVYGDFLVSYYGRALDEGDYATLDECLFFYYPRKAHKSSARAAREMCTSIKQFYAFLRAASVVSDDAFAQAMWRRRDQVARAVELYDRIDGDSPQFERLFAHLFAPYTA